MKETISALVDGELDHDETALSLNRLRDGVEVREAWDTYHLIGDALRGHLSPGVAARVAERLAGEPTVLAPRQHRRPAAPLRWAMSAAAGVAAVALVAWMALPLFQSEAQVQVAKTPDQGVQRYLVAHQVQSAASAMQGIAPYARLVSVDAGDRTGGR